MTKPSPALELREISFSYEIEKERVSILKKVSLRVEKGDFVAIQGPSGSGKSTLLYIIGCLLKFDEGKLYIDGTDTSQLTNHELAFFRNKKIGFIFQQFHLLAKTSVLDNILLPAFYPCETAHPSKIERQKAQQFAEKVGLEHRLHHLPNQLSGGQQQRVAIARALMNDADIILADEPTGNLDSKTSEQIFNLLLELNKNGKTIVLITHDPELAKKCTKTYLIRDGIISGSQVNAPQWIESKNLEKPTLSISQSLLGYFKMGLKLAPLALENIRRNRIRSALTMLGVIIGIASVLCMVTLGQYTKEKILESYALLGVNTLTFHGYPNWDLKATDKYAVAYRFFDWDRDIKPLQGIFPQIKKLTPSFNTWSSSASYGGRTVENDVSVFGLGAEALAIGGRKIILGRNFSPFHVEYKSAVCLIGPEIMNRLFVNSSPLDKIIRITDSNSVFSCKVIGVLEPKTSNQQWLKPNTQIYVPYTYFQAVTTNWWQRNLKDVIFQIDTRYDTQKTGNSIKTFFEKKYGKSGRFMVGSDSVLIAQMTKFLTLFTVMLATIALISLGIGGIGITNMMLVSVSERFKEIGLRKVLGATDLSIRVQFLVESLVICAAAGAVGLIMGFVTYETIILIATKFVSGLKFTWVFDFPAITLSLLSILIVGITSGIVPALKAEKLQVIEALRSE